MADVTGTSGNDQITPAGVTQGVVGQPTSGSDWIDAFEGHDFIDASDGDDIVLGGSGNDQVMLGAGDDTYFAGSGHDPIPNGTFQPFWKDNVTGGAGDDRYEWVGEALFTKLDDRPDGVSLVGGDSMQSHAYALLTEIERVAFSFGLEQNRVDLDLRVGSTLEEVVVDLGVGSDAPSAFELVGVSQDVAPASIMIEGAEGAVSLTGFESQVVIHNGRGSDLLFLTLGSGNSRVDARGLGGVMRLSVDAGSGADTIFAGVGRDTINGGDGLDFVSYGVSTAAVTIDLDDGIVYGGWAAGDSLTSVEGIGGSRFGDLVNGADAAERFQGNGGDDALLGRGGDDILVGGSGADLLEGGFGDDRMAGGDGDDRYFIDSAEDVVVEASATGGRDSVSSMIGYRLGAAVEDLTLSGSEAINGHGNGLGNSITGNMSANVLLGGGGADWLAGGAGNDRLVGGNGADQFVFGAPLNRSTNVDRISDFTSGQDKIVLAQAIFSGFSSPAGPIADGQFRLGLVALDADDRILYDRATGHIFYDADGKGGAVKLLFARLAADTELSYGDFRLEAGPAAAAAGLFEAAGAPLAALAGEPFPLQDLHFSASDLP